MAEKFQTAFKSRGRFPPNCRDPEVKRQCRSVGGGRGGGVKLMEHKRKCWGPGCHQQGEKHNSVKSVNWVLNSQKVLHSDLKNYELWSTIYI